jgi:hypothetical protein
MEYSDEEIAYVDFCVNNFSCEVGKRKCHIHASCYKNGEYQGLCDDIPNRMKNGEILSEDDREIIRFFQGTKQLEEDDCFVKDTDKPCPNRESCEKREDRKEKLICEELIQRLDLNAQKIAEKEIQRVILRDFPDIEWGLEEKIVLLDSEKPIPEINGRIDILLKGEATASLIVVELKLRATREHVGQLASYVGWYKIHPEKMPPPTKAAKGILLAENFDKGALSALEACPDLMAKICKLSVDIINVDKEKTSNSM